MTMKRGRKKMKGGADMAALEHEAFAHDILPVTGRGEKFKSAAALKRRMAAPKPRTFRIYTQLDAAVFEQMLIERGWTKEPDPRVPVALLHLDGAIQPRAQRTDQAAIIKSFFEGRKMIADKDSFYENATPELRAFMTRSTADAAKLGELKMPVYIKAATAARGEGNVLATTLADARRAWAATERPIATEYIMYPMLYKGRKTHIRAYLTVAMFTMPDGGVAKRAWFCHEGLVATAAAPYVPRDFHDGAIHDSHISTTDSLNFLSKSPMYRELLPRMIEAMRHTANFARYFSLFSEQRHGYFTFGVDFIYNTAARRIYVLELNTRVGMSYEHGGRTEISILLFGGIMAIIDAYHAGRYMELDRISWHTRVW